MGKKNFLLFGTGLLCGILLCTVFFYIRKDKEDGVQIAGLEENTDGDNRMGENGKREAGSETGEDREEITADARYPEWSAQSVYNGGETVLYENRIYKAKWWTQGERPGEADVWEDTLEMPAAEVYEAKTQISSGEPVKKINTGDFKVITYYPSWSENGIHKLQYEVLTHVIYAFAIPNPDGSLKPLENPGLAKEIITQAHQKGVKVLLAVGGWSYNDVPLESDFVSATENQEKLQHFGDNILDMCREYGFDGVDMDWEHPRVDGNSSRQYEALMLYLAEKLHGQGKLLTSAVVSGATADGNIYYDAAAHTDKVLEAVDWIHVMAYDGGDGERHSGYEFSVNCGKYWKETRQLEASKVILGVPFYSRPGWASYEKILEEDKEAWKKDSTFYNGMEVYYNGVDTIQKKTEYAFQNLGGIMIWEITQDTGNKEKSLLTAVGEELQELNGQ